MRGSKPFRNIVELSLIPLNSLLLFFLIFEPRIVLPAWLQVFGRMHPLALHFPIVLVLIFAVLTIFLPARLRKEHWFITALDALLLAAAITASVTALMGFALSGNEGYDAEAIAWHKWTGVFIPFVLHLFFIFRKKLYANIVAVRTVSVAMTVLISIAGHHGAVITHGENFILAPITPASVRMIPPFEEAYVYADLVQPILENKCVGCHNNKKSKGELIMDTRELFMKGGKEGVPWDTTREDLGIMMRRIHLPLEEKEHMPPKGKPQLTDEEVFILHEWVKRGADFEKKFTDLLPSDTLYAIGKKVLPSGSEEKYDFAAAEESLITRLNTNTRVITPVAIGSPGLSVTFYNKNAFKMAAVRELGPLGDNIVELNLSGMGVKDEDLAELRPFKNLRKLNLNFTDVTGKTLGQLSSLPFLKSLSLSGAPVEFAHMRALSDFPKLRSIYLWSTPAAASNLKELQEKNRNITWNAGFVGDTLVMQLTPPIIENEDQFIDGEEELKLKHYIKGTEIRYTMNGKDPDSIHAAVYKPGLKIDSVSTLRAKAYKPGWISSEVVSYNFYKRNYSPDSILLVTKPNKKYSANLGITLNDNVKSTADANSGQWLGFDKNNFEAVFRFPETVSARSVTFSILKDVGAWIFPPVKIEVWGGMTPRQMKLLGTWRPDQPDSLEKRVMMPLQCTFARTDVKYLRLMARPLPSMPAWHPEKGKTAYFFVDEIFVN